MLMPSDRSGEKEVSPLTLAYFFKKEYKEYKNI